MTALWLLFAALLIGGGWIAFEFLRAPLIPASPTFDERAATAAAVLQPDAPLFTDGQEAQIGLADHWRTYVDSLPVTHEREYR